MSAPDPAVVARLYAELFGDALAVDDLEVWYRELTDRLAVLNAVADAARLQRAQVVAHLHDTFGLTYAKIAERLAPLDKSRAAQLAAKGRPHITPVGRGASGNTC